MDVMLKDRGHWIVVTSHARINRVSMTTRPDDRRAFLQLLLAACALPVRGLARQDKPPIGNGISLDARTSSYHVHPRGRIQDALDAAARDPVNKTVYVHAGTYRPAARGQALIWFNARHDGITLEAVGDVTLTASNPEIADSRAPSYPAVVNHVVYFGDGVSRKTVLRGFKITGAKNFTTGSGDKSPIESDDLRKTAFFYTDGGGIKIYARSYPTIEHVEVYENYASPCGGGVSVEHLGQMQDSLLFRHCIFRNNGTQTTGAAIDLLHESRHDRELPVRRQRGQHGRRHRRPADRRRVSARTWLGGLDRVRRVAGHRQPEHVYGQLVRRRRRRQGQHLRRNDFLEQHAHRRHLGGLALRAGYHRRGRRARIVHSRRDQRSPGEDQP